MSNTRAVKIATLIAYHVVLTIVAVLIGVLGSNQCVRQDCVKKSKFIIDTMHLDTDPCNDFFRYACGNYKKLVNFRTGVIKQKKSFPYQQVKVKGTTIYPFASVIYHIEDNIDKEVRSLLHRQKNVTDDRSLKIIKKIFQPCTSISLVKRQGVRPLWAAIFKTGGFPLVEGDKWNEKAFSLGSMEFKSRKIGFAGEHIFQSYIAPGPKTPDEYFIHIEPPVFDRIPGHEIITDPETKNTLLDSNYASMVERLLFHLLDKGGYEKAEFESLRKQYEPGWKKIIEFKKELGKIHDAYLQLQDPVDLYNAMSLESLMSEFPYLDWKYYFQNMLVNSNELPSTVIVIGTSYFKGLKSLLGKTSNRELANFLVYQNILDAIRFLPSVYFAIYNKFLTNIHQSGEKNFLSRRAFCGEMVKANLRPALSSLFLETYNLTKNSQPILEDISRRIRTLIKNSIKNSEWMDELTKEEAFLKLKYTKFTLSLSDKELEELRSEEKRAKYYETLCIGTRQTQVLPNYFCLNKFKVMKNWELLSRKATVFDKTMHVFNSEITYNLKRNEFIIPYGVLQFPAFSGSWPGYVNYGGIGSRIGQKLTTGYDLTGSNENHLGFDKSSWWSPQTRNNYMQQAQCFADDYVKFVQRKGVMNGTRLMNIVMNKLADFQGLHVTYYAYFNYFRSRFLKEPTLPGLEAFTPKQLFFISYTNMHCAVYRPENETTWILENKYGDIYPEFKVVSSLQNEQGFIDAFQCKPGSNMNPAKKCNLMW